MHCIISRAARRAGGEDARLMLSLESPHRIKAVVRLIHVPSPALPNNRYPTKAWEKQDGGYLWTSHAII